MSGPVQLHRVGDTVEGYRILADLGQGAASWIYLVQDPKTKQVWALKHVHKGDAKDARFLDQAVFEAEVGQKMSHPNVRRVERVVKKTKGFFQLNDVYLVMELVDGVSMDIAPPTNFTDAVTIFHQVAQGLRHMHAKGFVHADMKPNNVIICTGPNAKIIDLGQSCHSGTIKKRIQGTPDYIAPEQVHRRPITERTDVYNLGATMYWTLTGRHIPTALPKGDALVTRIDDELMDKPVPIQELNPRIHPKLANLVMKCVEVRGEDRPESMAAVSDQLELILGILRSKVNQSREAGGSGSVDMVRTPEPATTAPSPRRIFEESADMAGDSGVI
jgi:serine/threonine-protein kinase